MNEYDEFSEEEMEEEMEEAVEEEKAVSRHDLMAAIDDMQEYCIDAAEAAVRFNTQELRKFKGLMQKYYRNF